MSHPSHRPALARLAHLLGVDATDLHELAGVPDPDLRALHAQVSHRLFAEGQHQFTRIAGLASSLPGPMAGKIAEKFLPAPVAARVAELLEPARARDLVGRLSLSYLCDVALALDPERSRGVVRAIAPERVGQVACELFRRGHHALLVDFLGAVTVEAFVVVLEMASPEDLAEVLPLVECDDETTEAFAALDPQVRAVVVARLAQLPAGSAPGLQAALGLPA
ncbi:hypothetical protein NPS01_02520 [Nocardioides psychrotolerans]|uniref:Uncharacterized protein n=1 Tax=Nocardioides psychrotolerans TaxID=1005945 RepID=A0A1I3BLU1_9ACTN|nr:hypothetical protein [Nocardioides psychrotolerans]GEP36589.1 hypothetical protein NPS01_02520 [Nocardioides psychrotolerans]SFH62741.1 hypothetical protein SAMN05216561_101187 [Nocardioides psychrotolerans]